MHMHTTKLLNKKRGKKVNMKRITWGGNPGRKRIRNPPFFFFFFCFKTVTGTTWGFMAYTVFASFSQPTSTYLLVADWYQDLEQLKCLFHHTILPFHLFIANKNCSAFFIQLLTSGKISKFFPILPYRLFLLSNQNRFMKAELFLTDLIWNQPAWHVALKLSRLRQRSSPIPFS